MSAKKHIVESLPAAANLLKTDIVVIKRAKNLGCPAFKPGNRIDVEELRAWIKEHTEELKATGDALDLKDQKLNEEIRKLKRINDQGDKKLILITDHETEIREMSSAVQKAMYALPARAPELAGLSVPDIEQKLTAWMDEVVMNLGKGETIEVIRDSAGNPVTLVYQK
jgi:hypothetical protein